jgi:hypothetical protein
MFLDLLEMSIFDDLEASNSNAIWLIKHEDRQFEFHLKDCCSTPLKDHANSQSKLYCYICQLNILDTQSY